MRLAAPPPIIAIVLLANLPTSNAARIASLTSRRTTTSENTGSRHAGSVGTTNRFGARSEGRALAERAVDPSSPVSSHSSRVSLVRRQTNRYTRPVRRVTFVIISLMALSFLLMPSNTVHAHIDDDHGHSLVHGGHLHDSAQGDEVHGLTGFDYYVSAQLVALDKSPGSMSAEWTPVFWFIAPVTPGVSAIHEVFRPPGDDPPLVHRHSWRRPPLRGPPLFSI